ncbi:MAG: GNAT family N-acetyltransferase [Spirochaetales bacterium]|nr:GNAT family N-acetyltransferase [Spirochaetales bacterium]
MEKCEIKLIPAEQDDMQYIYKWLNYENILQYFGGRDRKRPSVEDIENEFGPGKNGNVLMIWFKNRPVGFVDVFEFTKETNVRHGLPADEQGVISFDIVVGETGLQNSGIGSAAVNILLHLLFAEKNAQKVVLDTYTWHRQAIRCYEKCGFRVMRILKNHEIYEGKQTDDVFMEITKEDYIKWNKP